MTAGRDQSTRLRRTGRIIERPRLIKQLDDSEAPVILIVGPAGYGKTTLARQWARTLSGVIWVASTPSHRDVVTFSEDIAAGIDALGGEASRFIGEYMRARSNPQRAAREIAGALADRLQSAPVQWLVIDDYHELAESPEVEEMVSILRERIGARMVIASRVRPRWVSTRDVVYGDVVEVGAAELALTPAETAEVVGRRPDLNPLIEQARGWPAVLALAAGLDASSKRAETVPATLHRYVAEELYRSASPRLRDQLMELALLPDLNPPALTRHFQGHSDEIIEQARAVGFITGDERVELHPLLREFLLVKVAEAPSGGELVRAAVLNALDVEAWDMALDLVLRFKLSDLVNPVLQSALRPLIQRGRLGTLSAFAKRIREAPGFAPATVDLADAALAFHDGQSELASELASRAWSRLMGNDDMRCLASLILGRSLFFTASFKEAAQAFVNAETEARDEADETEAIFGLATVQIFGELGDPTPSMNRLQERRTASPELLVRHATAEFSLRRFTVGLAEPLPLAEPLHYMPVISDPKIRSAYFYTAAYALAQRADYRGAEKLLALFTHDVNEFGMEFAQPFLNWTAAFIKLGLRRFGEADRHIHFIEDAAVRHEHSSHALNARILRARLLFQTGAVPAAMELLQGGHETPVYPSWVAELQATRALGLALIGDAKSAVEAADLSTASTGCLEVHVLAHVARTLASLHSREVPAPVHDLFKFAKTFEIWDGVLCGLRSSPTLLRVAGSDEKLRTEFTNLLTRSGDSTLARRAGIRAPTTQRPPGVLSPRELEVLGLVARGLRNREIAAALYVAESTVKVHVRHILEKLGVRTRAEAVARYERAQSADRG